MKKILLSALMLFSIAFHATAQNYVSTDCETKEEEKTAQAGINAPYITKGNLVFYICNDMGRNGYYEQKPIARLMGNMADKVDLKFVAALGDVHHFMGVQSVTDPLWMTNYELIYGHPELMLPWYPVLGNHEYRGNTQSVLDYSKVSRRWNMPSRYYSKTVEVGNTKALLLFIDTAPMIDKYRKDTETYPDVCKQDRVKQLQWIENELKQSDAKWKIVMGHHPVYAQTSKSNDERADMQKYLKPLLDKYSVDAYICGHIHNFQHIQPAGSKTVYIVNSAASLSRKVSAIAGTKFCSPVEGFIVTEIGKRYINFYMINSKGETIHTVSLRK